MTTDTLKVLGIFKLYDHMFLSFNIVKETVSISAINTAIVSGNSICGVDVIVTTGRWLTISNIVTNDSCCI